MRVLIFCAIFASFYVQPSLQIDPIENEIPDEDEARKEQFCDASKDSKDDCKGLWVEEVGIIDPMLNDLDQEDPKLIELIKEKYLIKPPSEKPYNFNSSNPNLNGQYGQPVLIEKMLKQKKNGFFIEAGAYDGEVYSNSLLFELKHQWNGLLVEPNPDALEVRLW